MARDTHILSWELALLQQHGQLGGCLAWHTDLKQGVHRMHVGRFTRATKVIIHTHAALEAWTGDGRHIAAVTRDAGVCCAGYLKERIPTHIDAPKMLAHKEIETRYCERFSTPPVLG